MCLIFTSLLLFFRSFWLFFSLVCHFFSSKFTFCLYFSLCVVFCHLNLHFFDKVLPECFRASEIRSHQSVQLFTITEREMSQAKQGCLNIQNNDEKCFLWSILASLDPVHCRNSLHRVSKHQEYEHEFNMSGIQYPVDIKDIGKFKHQNNISVNVYGHKDKKIFPLSITTETTARHHMNLLYITAGETSRLILAKDLSR